MYEESSFAVQLTRYDEERVLTKKCDRQIGSLSRQFLCHTSTWNISIGCKRSKRKKNRFEGGVTLTYLGKLLCSNVSAALSLSPHRTKTFGVMAAAESAEKGFLPLQSATQQKPMRKTAPVQKIHKLEKGKEMNEHHQPVIVPAADMNGLDPEEPMPAANGTAGMGDRVASDGSLGTWCMLEQPEYDQDFSMTDTDILKGVYDQDDAHKTDKATGECQPQCMIQAEHEHLVAVVPPYDTV